MSYSNEFYSSLSKTIIGRKAGNLPEAAISYGQAILAAANSAEAAGRAPKLRRTILSRLGLAKTAEPAAIADQLDIVRAAGRWFVFSGVSADTQSALGFDSPSNSPSAIDETSAGE